MPDTPIHGNAQYPPSFRLRAIMSMLALTELDSMPVIAQEKVAATNTYMPSKEVIARTERTMKIRDSARNYIKIDAFDLIGVTQLRPIVIFGQTGSGKRLFCLILEH